MLGQIGSLCDAGVQLQRVRSSSVQLLHQKGGRADVLRMCSMIKGGPSTAQKVVSRSAPALQI